MKRICFVNPTIILRRPIVELAHLLAHKGYKITIFSPTKDNSPLKNFHFNEKLKHKNIKLEFYKTLSLPVTAFDWPIPSRFSFFKQVKRIFKTHDAIHMWAYFYLSSLTFAITKRLTKRTKFIISVDTLPAITFKTSKVMDLAFTVFNNTLAKFIFNSADTITKYSKSIPLKKAITFPTGIIPKTQKSKNDFRKKFKHKKIITFIGLLQQRKGVDIICNIARKFEAEFLIVGDGPKKQEYKKISPKNVHFLGRRNDIHSILKQTDIFFFPSRGEGLPGVVFEAMLNGVPVVASNISCIDEQIDNKKGGFLTPMDDEKQFIKAINKLLKNDTLRKEMGAYNKQRIKQFYWQNILPKYEELYNVRHNGN